MIQLWIHLITRIKPSWFWNLPADTGQIICFQTWLGQGTELVTSHPASFPAPDVLWCPALKKILLSVRNVWGNSLWSCSDRGHISRSPGASLIFKRPRNCGKKSKSLPRITQICGRACEAAGTSRFQGHSESTRSAFTLSQSTYLLWEAESRIWARVPLSVWEADLAVLELQLASEGEGRRQWRGGPWDASAGWMPEGHSDYMGPPPLQQKRVWGFLD